MRPKVVLFVFLIAIGVLAAAIVLKRVAPGGPSGAIPPQTSGSVLETPGQADARAMRGSTPAAAPEVVHNVQANPALADSQPPQADEARRQEIDRQLEIIHGYAADGQDDPAALAACLDAVTHPEKEVRQAAIETVVMFNDTNAVPRLRAALASIEDPHDKVALIDAIEYLQLPDALDARSMSNIVVRPTVQSSPEALSRMQTKSTEPGQPRERYRYQKAYPGGPIRRVDRLNPSGQTVVPYAPPAAPSTAPPK